VARGIIDVEGGLIALAPPVDGSITAAPVKEGATVKKGQLLLSLDGALLQQEVAMATADLALANDRLKGSQAQLRELERNATRLSTGASEGVSSNQQADAAKQLAGGTRRCRRGRCAGRHGPAQAGTRQLKLQQMSLSAPEAGTVVGQVPGLGAFVQAGKPAISLPPRPLQVRAELSAAYADAVQVGMKATVVPDSDGAENASTLPPHAWCASARCSRRLACLKTRGVAWPRWWSACWSSMARPRRASASMCGWSSGSRPSAATGASRALDA
jgi:multidrug resistance efflux pump